MTYAVQIQSQQHCWISSSARILIDQTSELCRLNDWDKPNDEEVCIILLNDQRQYILADNAVW